MTDIQIGIDPLIQRIIGVYHALGIWQNGNESGIWKLVRTFTFLFCTIGYPVALAGGGLVSGDLGDLIFLLTLGVVVAVIEFKGFYVFFKQEKILTMLNDNCNLSVPNNERLLRKVNEKLNILRKTCVMFIILSVAVTLSIMIFSSPLISHKLPFNIWFPLDYQNSRVAHWMAHCFVVMNELFVILVSLLSSIMWYIMLNCSIKYDILGYRFKNLGLAVRSDNQNVLQARNEDLFEMELVECIHMHKQLEKYAIIQVIKT